MNDHLNIADQERELNRRVIGEFRANDGRVGGPFEGADLLLLTTTGAKSGFDRLTPVAYIDIDGKRYIVGSAAGREAHPAWVFNIRGNPRIRVELGAGAPIDGVATELVPAERDRIFDVITLRAPIFAAYQAATNRVIPVFEVRLDT